MTVHAARRRRPGFQRYRRRCRGAEPRDRAQEPARRDRGRRRPDRNGTCRPSPRFASDDRPSRIERDADRAIAIRTVDAGPAGREPFQGGPGRMPVRVARARRGDRHARSNGHDEGVGRRRPAAMVGHLEDIDPGQSSCQQRWIDPILDVASQQEPSIADRPEQDDGHVVDARSVIRWLERHASPDRPADVQSDLVDGQPITCRDRPARRSTGLSQRL